MFRIAVPVAAGPVVAGARLLLAIWAAAARRQRFVVLGGSRSESRGGDRSTSSSSAASITLLSHSLTDLRDRRETGRAISSASGRRPLSFHGAPDFIRVQPTS